MKNASEHDPFLFHWIEKAWPGKYSNSNIILTMQKTCGADKMQTPQKVDRILSAGVKISMRELFKTFPSDFFENQP